jgi:hypothetical protein
MVSAPGCISLTADTSTVPAIAGLSVGATVAEGAAVLLELLAENATNANNITADNTSTKSFFFMSPSKKLELYPVHLSFLY